MRAFLGVSIYSLVLEVIFLIQISPGYRLPTSIKPEHYTLEIITNLVDDGVSNFDGKVWIKIVCLEPTSSIILHALNLEIDHSKINLRNLSDNEMLSISNVTTNYEDNFLIINMNDVLSANETYILHIQFGGNITEVLAGYYLSSYIDKKTGEKRKVAVTTFEPTDARRAFPCFDEPAFKSQFAIRLGHHKKYSAISNMPLSKTEPIDDKPDWVSDRFEDTVPMSTYLVAYMVSDLSYETSTSQSATNVTFRTWAVRDSISQVHYANEVGPKVLEYFENYFDIAYPLPKQDMVALPDFDMGAMENWGLITYRDSALLFDPEKSTAKNKRYTANVIAHELTHQWFGNLVTMKWWTDLWLKEGFATYIGGVGVDYLHPEWNSLQDEFITNTISVYSLDGLRSSHPVSVPIGHPNEITQIFDDISYNKGSALIRMMNLFLGEYSFKQGISSYLRKYQYGNADQNDLWESLTISAHKNKVLPTDVTVKNIMDTWTIQTGYPIVTIARDYSNNTVAITQRRYILNKGNDDSFEECWMVPLSYTTEQESNFNTTIPKDWLDCKTSTKTISNIAPADQWILFNIEMAGLYKVNYDENNWGLLTANLKNDNHIYISTITRAQLVDDAMDLAWTGDLPYSLALDLARYLKNDTEYVPWLVANKHFSKLKRMLQRKPTFYLFEEYMREILTPLFKQIGGLYPKAYGDRFDLINLHVLIADLSCTYNVGDCKETAINVFSEWQTQQDPDKNNPIPADVRDIVYCTAISYGGSSEWEFLWERYLNNNVASTKQGFLESLGCSKDSETLKRYLSWTQDEEHGIRKQDVTVVFESIARYAQGFEIAKDFLYKNIADIYQFLNPSTDRIADYIESVSERIINDEESNEFKNFTTDAAKYLDKCRFVVDQGLEIVQINLQWQQRFYDNLTQLLREEYFSN